MKLGAYGLLIALIACGVAGTASSGESGTVIDVAEIAVNETSNGTTIEAAPGQVIALTLNSTSWQVAGSSDRAVVVENAAPSVRPAPVGKCPPGVGCGVIQMAFTARKQGVAHITASRTLCGEDLLCRPDQRAFGVTVIVH
jgi:hypothetical protein